MRAKWMQFGMVGLLGLALTAAGCGGPSRSQTGSGSSQRAPVTLTVWSHFTDPEVAAVKQVAEKWAKKTGNKVTVIASQGSFQDFLTAARSGKAPDIMFGLPHDNLGTFEKAGLLAPVPGDVLNPADYPQVALDAVRLAGKYYAVPLTVETYALLINSKKIPAPPTAWDEFLKDAQRYGFQYDINNFYFSYAFLGAYGGYVFARNDQGLDPTRIGLDSPGSIEGLGLVRDFVLKYHFMPATVTGDIAKATFTQGKSAMYITGPWDVQGLQQAKVPFQVVPLEKLTLPGGAHPKPYVGVYTAFVNGRSKNQQQAWELVKYLTQNATWPLYDAGHRLPARTGDLNDPRVQNDPVTRGFSEAVQGGEAMPNIPEMQAVWTPTGNMLQLVTAGKQPVEKAAQAAIKQIQTGIAGMK